ncbi:MULTISPECIES: tail fiber assembly protein [Pseudomonas syringae group]|uniref:Tail fiber assembly domain protein n=2 Tax=Pseudomonas syringae group genomosp. 3 TaxID=251701 RepID=Q87Y71_PSESM|nr:MULTISPECIES: tail fiber assembly protein [Pseudomonas syringae group]KPC07571.1 Tail fiber assembly domain protein [Pseudomonas amygdali pv. lachrymans]AAO57398.1 tail fiber assembly domain protein [Pseudomonas syringae pv. tomato str. DC3000]EGH99586.1 tail fiber assembly domain protein [Pseudomonas amygdali pv. lachrymans str. M302278]KKI25663.1 tail fiber assembly protein [Pseudomonas syringae pv. persicae]KPB91215.1 Tail fiber assembly domain protein [Pseudomonas syringae pv. maculicol
MSNIDWSRLITKEMKQEQAAKQRLADVVTEIARLRKIADYTIAPLQDAVDIDDATADEVASLKAWKQFRVALNRIPAQPGYYEVIDWPVMPT